MAARAIWKARLALGEVEVPVKLYSAVESRSGVHFRLLDPKSLSPVKQRMVAEDTGEEVETAEVSRGYEVESGLLVRLDEEELDSLEPEPSREIELVAFLPPSEIDHRWYDRPYYLGPDGDDEAYFALVAALEKEDREGLVRWTMRKKRYVGALGARDGYLVLITLRHAEEVVDAADLPRPKAQEPTKAEQRMAEQLVATLEAPFEPQAYRDEYRERVLELVEAKREGRVVPFREGKRKPKEESLERMLEQSLERAGAA